MTTVAAEPTGRSRLDQYRRQESSLVQREADLVAFIEASPARESEARLDAFRKAPHALPSATSSVERERRKRVESERSLETVRFNLAAIRELLAECEAAEKERARRKLDADARQFQNAERDAYRALGGALETFVRVYVDQVLAAVEGFDQWRETACAEFGVDAEAWRNDVARHVVEPIPSDALAAFTMLLDAAADPRQMGYRRDVDSPDARPVDDGDELRHLVSDLRSVLTNVTTARGPRRHSDYVGRMW